jgi:CTP:molybdopterin cytidylyltransferase MocA
MGSNKLVADFGGRPLIVHAVTNVLDACRRAIVVVGHGAEDVRRVLSHAGSTGRIVVVENPDFRRGMITSIACGTRVVATERFFVAPADMPFLAPGLFQTVAGSDPGNADAVLPVFQGSPAHPALIRTAIRDSLQALMGGDKAELPSMRKFLQRFVVIEVTVHDDGSIVDIDTTEGLARYTRRANDTR